LSTITGRLQNYGDKYINFTVVQQIRLWQKFLIVNLIFRIIQKRMKKKLILQTKIRNENSFMFPNPSHFVKLIRNTFTEKDVPLDDRNEKINFNYLRKLNEL